MKKEEYEILLNEAPPHDSPEFIDFLRENNVVVFENEFWIVIENCKYKGWHTAFWKERRANDHALSQLLWKYNDWEWLKKDKDRQTINRFHVHFYRSNK